MASSREPEVRELLHDLVVWCSQRADVQAVALVGSWARDDARYDSDVDVVLLKTDRGRYLATDDWLSHSAQRSLPLVSGACSPSADYSCRQAWRLTLASLILLGSDRATRRTDREGATGRPNTGL